MRFLFQYVCAVMVAVALWRGHWIPALGITVVSGVDLALTLMGPRYFIERRERRKANR